MENFFHRLAAATCERKILRFFLVPAVILLLLYGCDSEREKEWKRWMIEVDKVDYRCGTFGDYELKISKAYLFYWPTYEGRSDWESNPPPPLSCTAKLKMMPIEAYWPGMVPAGRRPLSVTNSGIDEPDYISIRVRSAPDFIPWKLDTLLNYRLNNGDDPKLSYGEHIYTEIGLYRTEKPYVRSPLSSVTYFWEVGPNNTVKTFVDCILLDNGRVNSCRQIQYLPWLRAVLEIRYQRPQLENWRVIAFEAEDFIKHNSTYMGECVDLLNRNSEV